MTAKGGGDSLDAILDEFRDACAEDSGWDWRKRKAVTVWLPEGLQERYIALQDKSGRKFSRTVRRAIVELIEKAEAAVG